MASLKEETSLNSKTVPAHLQLTHGQRATEKQGHQDRYTEFLQA
jgi:hypothetical protein